MKLTALDLAIILDALRGTLSISDNGLLFVYNRSSRMDVINKIMELLKTMIYSIDEKENSK